LELLDGVRVPRPATRFDKRAASYRAAVVIVSLLLWLP